MIKKFKNFFKSKKTFEQKLIEFEKFIDSSCDEIIKISGVGHFNINKIKVVNHESYIEIKLIQEEKTYISITINYNKDKKLDLLTWHNTYIINGSILNKMGFSSFIDENDELYDAIRNYLIQNKLIGQVI